MKQLPIPKQRCGDATRMPAGTSRGAADRVVNGPFGRQHVLKRAFSEEVLPRLLTTRSRAATACVAKTAAVTTAQVERLLALVLTSTQAEATAYVVSLRDGGLPAASILLELLTPVARQLGRMWEDDTCDFSDVTVGLGRLAHLVRMLDDGCDEAAPLLAGPSALLVQMPGEQHGFGLALVVHFFRHGGWRVRHEPVLTSAELVGIVERSWFGIVGVSVACSDRLNALADDVRAIRRRSRNPDIGIMVGGPPFLAHPQLAALVGADATAVDGQQAVREAHRLVGMRARAR